MRMSPLGDDRKEQNFKELPVIEKKHHRKRLKHSDALILAMDEHPEQGDHPAVLNFPLKN